MMTLMDGSAVIVGIVLSVLTVALVVAVLFMH